MEEDIAYLKYLKYLYFVKLENFEPTLLEYLKILKMRRTCNFQIRK